MAWEPWLALGTESAEVRARGADGTDEIVLGVVDVDATVDDEEQYIRDLVTLYFETKERTR